MTNTRRRTQALTVLLLKPGVKSFREALRAPDLLKRAALKTPAPYEGEFWYLQREPRSASWTEFVQPVLEESLGNLQVSSVSAVLFVKSGGRIFAFTFGYGRNLLRADCHERDFGLKVALNRIHPERLKSVDLRTYEDMVVITRKQTSRAAQMGSFGLDISRDLLRGVAGDPEGQTFAKRLAGRDALTFWTDISIEELGSQCEAILAAYNDVRYKERFGWVDHVRIVRDPNRLEALNRLLVEALKARAEHLQLAPPEPVDWAEIDAFRIDGTGQRRGIYDDLDINAYLDDLGDGVAQLTLRKLKQRYVSIRWRSSDVFDRKWRLFDCIVWETDYQERQYVLAEGEWFEVEPSFAAQVRRFVMEIPRPKTGLPPAQLGERENDYNRRVSSESGNLFCLDGQTFRPVDASSPIELCDLLSADKLFFHVKRKRSSATLSHLFSQGSIAAEIFMQDGGLREQVRNHLKDAGAAKFIDAIPGSSSRPDVTQYQVVYAIISRDASNGRGMLTRRAG